MIITYPGYIAYILMVQIARSSRAVAILLYVMTKQCAPSVEVRLLAGMKNQATIGVDEDGIMLMWGGIDE